MTKNENIKQSLKETKERRKTVIEKGFNMQKRTLF